MFNKCRRHSKTVKDKHCFYFIANIANFKCTMLNMSSNKNSGDNELQ